MNNKILVIGDMHWKEHLRYHEYVVGGRDGERADVLQALVDSAQDCDTVVLVGDVFDVKNPPSSVVHMFTEFLERFGDKEVFIIAGNHEKFADGKTALDYLKEVKNKKWNVITDRVSIHGNMTFCPYFFKEELGCKTHEEATAKVMDMLQGGEILFSHHAVSDTITVTGQSTNLFPEVVLPKEQIESRYKLNIAGHIHKPADYGRSIVTGCTMSNEVGDSEKFAWKITNRTEAITWEKISLPIRPIVKIENPTVVELDKFTSNSIVKAVFTDKANQPTEEIKERLRQFDAFIILEQYPNERKKLTVSEGAMLDYSVEQLLDLYSKEKKVDKNKLLAAWELIK